MTSAVTFHANEQRILNSDDKFYYFLVMQRRRVMELVYFSTNVATNTYVCMLANGFV